MRESNLGRNEQTNHSSKFLLGALIGGMAGAAAALLFTSKSGKELCKNLLDQTALVSENVLEKSSGLASYAKKKPLLKTSLIDPVEDLEEEKTNYISLSVSEVNAESNKGIDVRKKLEEAKKALEEEEKRVLE
jgi:gas vesicle protein